MTFHNQKCSAFAEFDTKQKQINKIIAIENEKMADRIAKQNMNMTCVKLSIQLIQWHLQHSAQFSSYSYILKGKIFWLPDQQTNKLIK